MLDSLPGMKVTLLGTGSPIPDPQRAGAATLVQTGTTTLLFDCGRGVLMRLAAAGLFPIQLDRVLLTHLHSDHTTDLNDLITTRWVMSPASSPLPIVGPAGTRALVDRTIEMLGADIDWRMAHHADLNHRPSADVTEIDDGLAGELNDVRVLASPTDHRPVAPTLGYRVEHGGRAVVIAGDTVPCNGLDRLCRGADVYVQTVTRPDLMDLVPSARFQEAKSYHSSCADAGRTAARAGVQTLVLTHQIPPPAPGAEAEWIALAARHFDGDIVFGQDLATIET